MSGPENREGTHPRIVIGVDGSEGSLIALHWAVAQARQTEASLQLVGAWSAPVTLGLQYGLSPALYDDQTWIDLTGHVVNDALALVRPLAGPDVSMETLVVEGPPAQVLLEAAKGADLLVLGSRGHSPLVGALMGSVSQHCVQHSPCPVVIVPASAQVTNAQAVVT